MMNQCALGTVGIAILLKLSPSYCMGAFCVAIPLIFWSALRFKNLKLAGTEQIPNVVPYRDHLVLVRVVGRACSPLPAHLKKLVWSFLRNPYKIQIMPSCQFLPLLSGHAYEISMQTGQSSAVPMASIWNSKGAIETWARASGAPHFARSKEQESSAELEIINKPNRFTVAVRGASSPESIANPPCVTWEQQGCQQPQLVFAETGGDRSILLEFRRDTNMIRLCPGYVVASVSQRWAAVLINGRVEVFDLRREQRRCVCEAGAKGVVAVRERLVVVHESIVEVHTVDDALFGAHVREVFTTNIKRGLVQDVSATEEALVLKIKISGELASGNEHVNTWTFSLFSIAANTGRVCPVGALTAKEPTSRDILTDSEYSAYDGVPVGVNQLAVLHRPIFGHGLLEVWSFGNDCGEACLVQTYEPGMDCGLMLVDNSFVKPDWITRGPDSIIKNEEVPHEQTHVIENVNFEIDEPVAEISPEEAALTEEARWASQIEHGFFRQPATHCDNCGAILLTFSRGTKRLEQAILASPPGRSASEKGVVLKPHWAHGAKVLVEGMTPEHVEAPVIERLGAQHVLINKCDVEDLMQALEKLPYSIRKLKPEGMRRMPEYMSFLGVSSSGSSAAFDDFDMYETAVDEAFGTEIPDYEIQVRHTFIHFSDGCGVASRSVHTV